LAAIGSGSYECIDWVLEVLDPPAPHDVDWLGCAIWGMYLTHFVARGEDRAHMLSRVDPDAIPSGVLRFAWLNDHASIAIASHEPLTPFLQPMLDTATAIDDDFYRLCWSGQVLLLAILAGELHFASIVWERFTADPARGTLPMVEGLVAYFEGIYLAALGDVTAREHFEHARQVSAQCGWSTLEPLAGSAQVPLLIDAGDLSGARQRMIEATSGHIRAGDHLTLWITCHQLVRLLAALGHDDQAREIWAELRDRGGWSEPSLRADLEARLGTPGTPHLDDDELIARISTLIGELK
jgi:hypothetical protein